LKNQPAESDKRRARLEKKGGKKEEGGPVKERQSLVVEDSTRHGGVETGWNDRQVDLPLVENAEGKQDEEKGLA